MPRRSNFGSTEVYRIITSMEKRNRQIVKLIVIYISHVLIIQQKQAENIKMREYFHNLFSDFQDSSSTP